MTAEFAKRQLRLFFAILILGVSHFASAANTPTLQKQALILVSVEFGGPGIDQYVAALNAGLKKGGMKSTDIHVEYLGLPGIGNHLRAPLAAMLKEKYRDVDFGLVFCVQQPALNFLLNEARGLAPHATVLSAYATLPPGTPTDQQSFVFQTSRLDYRGTLQRALELFPRTERVIVIQGNSELELSRQENIREDLAPWQGKLQIEDTSSLSFDEIDAKIATATDNTIIMGVGILKDAQGQIYLPNESYARIVKFAKVPAFVLYDTTIGTGFVGGMVTRIGSDAAQLSAMGIDILNGVIRLTEPVSFTSNPSTPMFDWQQLKRWKADPAVLPADTVFVNQPLTLWGQYRGYVILAALSILVLVALIVALLIQNRRRRLAELRFRMLFQQASEAILVLDVEAPRIVDANPSAEKLFGCSRDKLLEGGLMRFYADQQPDGRPVEETRAENIQAVMRGGMVQTERAIRTFDGRDLICEVRLDRLPDTRHQRLRASILDVTQRKQAETELRKLFQAVEQSPHTIVITDLESRIEYANAAVVGSSGYTAAELIGQTPSLLQSGQTPRTTYESLWATLARGEVWRGEFINRRKDRTIYTEFAIISPIRQSDGCVTHYLAIKEDITERKKTEELRSFLGSSQKTENKAR